LKEEIVCPFCEDPIEADALIMDCPSCGMAHHIGCWQESRGCANEHCPSHDERWMSGGSGKKPAKKAEAPAPRRIEANEHPSHQLTSPRGAESSPALAPSWGLTVITALVAFALGMLTMFLVGHHEATGAAPDTPLTGAAPESTGISLAVPALLIYQHSGIVYRLPAEGGLPVPVTQQGGAMPNFSADGGRIVYVNKGIWIINADGSNPRALTTDTKKFTDYGPAFSPDGRTVIFTRDNEGKGGDLYTMTADGRNQRALTHHKDGEWWLFPSYNATGTQLVVCNWQRAMKTGEVDLLTLDGKPSMKLATAAEMLHPSFSADGARVAYCRSSASPDGTEAPGVYAVNTGGGVAQCLVPATAIDGAAAFDDAAISPDGKQVLFSVIGTPPVTDSNHPAAAVATNEPTSYLYIANVDGSGLHKVGDGLSPRWNPTGVSAPPSATPATP